jgi:protein-tyrosine-phosphatase
MCPHAAGKSLFAATYLRAAAGRNGIDVEIGVAGPDPDPENMPNVTAALESQGYTIGWHPRLVTADDTSAADLIISIGCDHTTIPTTVPIKEWDVPLLSEDFEASMRAIHTHAERLAAELADTSQTP